MEENASLEEHFVNVLIKARERHEEPPTYSPETKYNELIKALIDFYYAARR